MNLQSCLTSRIDGLFKGIPGDTAAMELGDIAQAGWNLLGQGVPLPACVIKDSAVRHNESIMREFTRQHRALHAPHGKTTMSPQLFERQLAAGAWAITVATIQQLRVAREFGVQRVFYANQMVGRPELDYLTNELARDPNFEFYGLVDSVRGVQIVAEHARARGMRNRINLLIEGGFVGGRCGVRSLAQARHIAAEVRAHEPYVQLRGVEGFEGLFSGTEAIHQVSQFLDYLCEMAQMVDAEGFCRGDEMILSAGGSAYFDLVVHRFEALQLTRPVKVVLRSGCYLTHDSGTYEIALRDAMARDADLARLGPPRAALEVWGYVVSRPEPTRAILNVGKRDVSFDVGLPDVRFRHRPNGGPPAPQQLVGHRCVRLNDQHAYLDIPAESPLDVGDMVGLGISHPCLTFDKWQLILVVDDAYNVISGLRTYF